MNYWGSAVNLVLGGPSVLLLYGLLGHLCGFAVHILPHVSAHCLSHHQCHVLLGVSCQPGARRLVCHAALRPTLTPVWTCSAQPASCRAHCLPHQQHHVLLGLSHQSCAGRSVCCAAVWPTLTPVLSSILQGMG